MAEFRVAMPAGATATEVTTDLIAQLGPRSLSARREPDGLYLAGEITEAEATATLAGFAARKQQAADAEAARLAELTQDRGDLPALLQNLVDDRARLLDTTLALNIAQLRVIMARIVTLELLIVRHLRRGGL